MAPRGSSERSPESSAPTNSLGFEGQPFSPPDGAKLPPIGAEQAAAEAAYVPPPPQPIDWNAERAEPILRGLGYLLHGLDDLGDEPGAEELWKMTEADLEAIAEPMARIANRYEMTRRVAGKSDEISLGVAIWPYVQRNAALRGRTKALRRRRDEAPPTPHQRPAAPIVDPAPDPKPEPQVVYDALTVDEDGQQEPPPEQYPHPDPDDVFGAFPLQADVTRPPHETNRG